MNKLESTIYNLVRKNPALKQFVRNMYQGIFDLLPRKKEYFASPYQYREGFFFGFHDVTPFSFDETKLLANQNRLDLRMPLPSDGLVLILMWKYIPLKFWTKRIQLHSAG